MKNLGFMAVVALLMMFGCSKDEMITTEQESISAKENNQPIINGEKGPNVANHGIVKHLQFFSTSNESGGYYDLINNPSTGDNRKLLKKGTFSGKLNGIGSIKSSSSAYEFSLPEETISQKNDSIYCDESGYNLKAEGVIKLSLRDSCSITITGYLCTTADNIASFNGVAKTHSGVGKLKSFDKWFKVFQGGISSPGINLTTGEIRLQLVEYNFK